MKNYLPVALGNIGITLCFALVAIWAGHWWIILFSILGWNTLKYK